MTFFYSVLMSTSCLMEWLSDFCGVDDGDASGDGTVHWHGRRPLCSGDQPAWTSTPLLWRSTGMDVDPSALEINRGLID
jgi:hypothetical protein